MARSDYLFGYDPRKKDPWLDYVPNQITNRVSQQPQRKRSNWLARGNIRAAHAGRRASRLDEQQQMQQQMGQRQNALMESRMPLEERKFRQSQIEYGQGRQDKFGMQQAGFQNQEFLSRLGNQFAGERADISEQRGIEGEGRAEKRIIGAEGRALSRADQLRPIEQQEKKEYFDYTQQNRINTPQYQAIEGPTGEQGFIEKGVGSIGAGNKLTSPGQTITMNQPKPAPSEERMGIIALQDLKRDLMEAAKLYDPRYVGMLDSMLGSFRDKTGLGINPNETSFRQLMSTMVDMAYIKSGKQISPQEMLILRDRMPSIEISDPAFETRMNTFIEMLEGMLASRSAGLQQSGYISPAGDNQEPQGMTNEQLIQAFNEMRGQ